MLRRPGPMLQLTRVVLSDHPGEQRQVARSERDRRDARDSLALDALVKLTEPKDVKSFDSISLT